jgi:demethylspheroidene O-methyltransferase
MRGLISALFWSDGTGNSRARTVSFRDRWRELRNRLVADPRVQRIAISNPLTRRVARRKARELFDLCAGFVYSQILAACVRLNVFELLQERSLSVEDLGQAIDLKPEATRRLVDGAAALGLLELRVDGRVGLGELGAALNANPGVRAMVHHHAALYEDLRDPVGLLRGEAPSARLNAYWAYATADEPDSLSEDDVAEYSDLMSASQQLIADEVLAAYPLNKHRRLLDVGGGDGTFAAAAALRFPKLEVITFDLPAVAQRANARFRAANLGHRAKAVGGNFVRDRLPGDADVISLVRVLYDHGDDKVLDLLKAVRAAMPSGGRLLIAEPMADAPGAPRVGDAYFGFYLLAMGSGRPRRPAEFAELLQAAGFSRTQVVATRMPLQTGLILAQS